MDQERPAVDSHQDQSLYVIADIRDIELRRLLIYPGSSLNIMPYLRSRIECHVWGSASFTTGSVNLDQTIGPMQTTIRLHLIDAWTSYHLLLRRPWIHKHKVVPFTYHQCLKAIWKDKKAMSMPLNACSSKMKFVSQRQLSLRSCSKMEKQFQLDIEIDICQHDQDLEGQESKPGEFVSRSTCLDLLSSWGLMRRRDLVRRRGCAKRLSCHMSRQPV